MPTGGAAPGSGDGHEHRDGSEAMVEPPTRALRIAAAAVSTALAPLVGFLVIALGRGRMLEDACLTEPPSAWAPELTVVRGPLSQGLVTFRCEKASSPVDPFVFTDARPLALSVVVVLVAVALVAGLWAWALRRAPALGLRPRHSRTG